MSEVQSYAPGTFSWIELGTTDQEGAKTFYGTLFGWQPKDVPMGQEAPYTLLQVAGQDVAGLYTLTPEQRGQNVPPNWLAYVTVASADEAAEKAKALGGEVVMDVQDVWDLGRMAVLKDPTGGTFAVWQAKSHIGSYRTDEAGTRCWTELGSHDVAAAEAFYTGLFGWRAEKMNVGDMGTYTVFHNGDRMAAGLFEMPPEWSESPSLWITYFAVDDCDAATHQARSLGAAVQYEPSDIPGIGRFALLQDPQGAGFALLTPVPQEAAQG